LRDAMEEIDRLRTENYWIIKNSSDELDEQEAHWKQRVSELERAIPVVTDGRFNAASAIQHLKDCAEWERMEDEGG